MKRAAFLITLLACLGHAAEEVAVDPPAPTEEGSRVAVLGYHDFSETEPETAMRINTTKFRRQLETLGQLGITVISLDDFIAWKKGEKEIPAKSALITLDDGWKSVYTDAFPILRELGMPFTLYLYKKYIDGGNKALTSAMIREMMKAGATIGSHSDSHPYPVTVKERMQAGAEEYESFLRHEMGGSKQFLESRFKSPVTTYAYPGGFHTDEMLVLGHELGYSHMFTVLPGKVTRATPDDRIPRYMILGNYDKIFEFATTFRDPNNPSIQPEGAIAGLIQTTEHPVRPEPGIVINSRLPEIEADLSRVAYLDPSSLVMKVSGFGQVPASYSPETGKFSWTVNRRLRHLTTQVSISWKDLEGNAPDKPLRWSFQIDRESAYLPDGE